jgi:hypothetical protein
MLTANHFRKAMNQRMNDGFKKGEQQDGEKQERRPTPSHPLGPTKTTTG